MVIIPANTSWGSMQDNYKITSEGKITDVDGNPVVAIGNMSNTLETARSENIPVMIQEFGVYNKTPHNVTVPTLLMLFQFSMNSHVGYAMWNLIGTMGIINSERTDVDVRTIPGETT